MLQLPSTRRRKIAGAVLAAAVAFVFACSPFESAGRGVLDDSDAASRDAALADVVAPLADGAATSCADVLARDPARRGHSGKFTIDPDGVGAKPSVLVYCEMAIDDGGWTLVARSSLADAPFGWAVPTGSVADVGPSYSLDIADAGLAFSEVLIADRKAYEYEPAAHAYRFAVPDNFLVGYAGSPLAIDVQTVIGDCVVDGGPAGLHYAGYTGFTDRFYFGQDPGGNLGTGLHPDVFVMNASDCESGASLDQLQGLIFVR